MKITDEIAEEWAWHKGLDDSDLDALKDYIEKNVAEVEEALGLSYCGNCDEFVSTGTHWIDGRTGGYENWLPDELVVYCQDCGREIG